MASRFDNRVNLDKLSAKQAPWALSILADEIAKLDADMTDLIRRAKADKRPLFEAAAAAIDAAIGAYLDGIADRPWELIDECRHGGLRLKVHAASDRDILVHYVRPLMAAK